MWKREGISYFVRCRIGVFEARTKLSFPSYWLIKAIHGEKGLNEMANKFIKKCQNNFSINAWKKENSQWQMKEWNGKTHEQSDP